MFYMSNQEEKNKALDELLHNMPKFTDNRSKDEVYNRVKLEMDSSDLNKVIRNNKSFSKWMPLLVSVASVLLLTFLISSYLGTSSEKSAIQQQATDKSDMLRTLDVAPASEVETTESGMEAKEDAAIENSNDVVNSLAVESELVPVQAFNNARTVYEDDLNDGIPFHFSVTEGAEAYPITIIIPKDKINEDFTDGLPNSLQLYEKYASTIDESALGFEEYLPLQGNLVSDGDTLQHYLPKGHGYDAASATSGVYTDTIRHIFTDFSFLERLSEDGTAINWDQVGVIGKKELASGNKERMYFKHTMNSGLTFLVPKDAKFENAFKDMPKSANDLYTTVVPKDVSYEVSEEGNTVVITFDEALDLATLEYEDSILMIEAFTLTAASFDKTVRLENVVQKQWDRFDLTATLPIPIGPNGYMMNH